MEVYPLLIDNSLWNLLIRFFVNLVVLFILVGVIYYKFSKKEEYLFSYVLIGLMIFLICSILATIDLKVGTALGLFAIFAIIRFRTVQYTVKDMTYVFLIIGISVINSQANIPPPIFGAVLVNASILLITYLLELFLQKKSLNKLLITYNKLELLKPGHNNELLKDLSRHTGQNIEKVTIKKINTRKSNAEIEVYFNNTKTT
jgi:hypothetical protein